MRLSRQRDLIYKIFECVNSDYDTYIVDFFEGSNLNYLQIADKYRGDILDKINISYPEATAANLHYLINLVFGLISVNPVNPLSFHFHTLISNLNMVWVGDSDDIPQHIRASLTNGTTKCLCNHSSMFYINIFRNKQTGKCIHIGNDCITVINEDMGKICKFLHQVLNDKKEFGQFKKCSVCLGNKINKYLGSFYYQTYFLNNNITPYLIKKVKKSYALGLCIKHASN